MSDSARLSEDEVRHVARLSRLALSDDEVRQFADQLSSVLQYMTKLNELDVDDVEPMAHAVDITNVLDDDEVGAPLPVDDVLANTADRSDPFFKVPKVLGDDSGA